VPVALTFFFEEAELTSATARFVGIANCAIGTYAYIKEQHPDRIAYVGAVARSVRVKKRVSLTADAERLLRVSWQTEAAAGVAKAVSEPGFQRISSHTLPVQAYYAIFNSLRALAATSGFIDVDARHARFHEDFGRNRAARLPTPWNVRLAGDPRSPASTSLSPPLTPTIGFNPMERRHAAVEYVWMALLIARRWKLREAIENWIARNPKTKAGKPRKGVTPGAVRGIAADLYPTTLLDFIYELRRQANYETADEYFSEADDDDVERFHEGLLGITDCALMSFESWLSLYVGKVEYCSVSQR